MSLENKMSSRRILLVILFVSLFIKLFIDSFVETNKMNGTFKDVVLNKQFLLFGNGDDNEIGLVARNFLEGKGFETGVSGERPKYRTENEWPTAFRPMLNVLVHIVGLKIYCALNPGFNIHDIKEEKLPYDYMENFALTIFIIKNILFIISLFYLYRLSKLYFNDEAALTLLILYCLYPSIILYVGMFDIYECIIMPCLVIMMSIHLYNRRFNIYTVRDKNQGRLKSRLFFIV